MYIKKGKCMLCGEAKVKPCFTCGARTANPPGTPEFITHF